MSHHEFNEVRCPHCNKLLFRVRTNAPATEIEIKCHGCKQIIILRPRMVPEVAPRQVGPKEYK